MARTPVGSGATTLSRSIGFNGGGNSGTRSRCLERLVVEGTTEGVDHASEQFRADADRHGSRPRNHRSPGRMPVGSPSGTVRSVGPRKPTTWTGSGGASFDSTSQISPSRARGPDDSMTRPVTRLTCPCSGSRSAAAAMST